MNCTGWPRFSIDDLPLNDCKMVYRIAANHYKNETWAAIAEAQTDDRPFVWWVAGMGRTPGIPMSDLLTLTYPAYKPTKSDDDPTQPSPTPAKPARWRSSTDDNASRWADTTRQQAFFSLSARGQEAADGPWGERGFSDAFCKCFHLKCFYLAWPSR